MIDIQQRLQTLFEKHRIIFWYDDNGALEEEFEKVGIAGVEKRIINNNEFTLKREVLKLSPQGKFLIYSHTHPPKKEDNWLLDLNIANHMFSADKISLILQNLGLDVGFKLFMKRFEKFLNAKSRVEALARAIGSNETKESLMLKMIAVSLGSDDTVESILLHLFEAPESYEVLEKFDFAGEFFKIIRAKYGYNGDTLSDFSYKLLQNHFYHSIDKSKCTLNSDARLFVNTWMDSSRYKDGFESIAKDASATLNIKAILEAYEPEKILYCDTYEVSEQIIIMYLLQLASTGDAQKIVTIIEGRKNTFWYERYHNIYQAILYAVKLIDFVEKIEFEMRDFSDGIEKYAALWYKADLYYREYSTYAFRAERIELLKEMSEHVENLYLNAFLRELNDTWQHFSQSYDVRAIKERQRGFYEHFVAPSVKNNKKIFIIISDALRYECGKALVSRILLENRKKDRFSATCKHMVSSLPSYTQLGMASLLPHKTLGIGDKNDTVLVDGKSCAGLLNRDKILKSCNEKSVAIGYEAFLSLGRIEGREFAKNHQVIYIYHDEIDKMGEKNEPKTFDAVSSTFDTIIKTIKQISNFNGVNILITSDHGFLFTNQPTLESEFCVVPKNDALRQNRRFVIGKNLESTSCVVKYSGEVLGIEGENEFLIPKSINKIRVQGGGNRFVHGGATLQELVIPLIEVNISKNKAENTKEVTVEIVPIRNISTNSVNVSLYQTDLMSEQIKPLTLKVGFESIDGKALSDSATYTFASDDSYETNREKRFKLTFKQDINAFNNKTIKLVTRRVLEGSSESPLYKELETKLVLSFFNDFDDDF